MKYTLCYVDENNTASFCETNDASAWQALHPHFKIKHMFSTKQDIQRRKTQQEIDFLDNCERYGMSPYDLGRQFTAANGNIVKLTGYRSENRKYKFIIHDETQNKTYKVTPEYMHALKMNA